MVSIVLLPEQKCTSPTAKPKLLSGELGASPLPEEQANERTIGFVIFFRFCKLKKI
jgi:hypothetical protein